MPPKNSETNTDPLYAQTYVTQICKETGDTLVTPTNLYQPNELKWDINWQDFGITPDFLSSLQPH